MQAAQTSQSYDAIVVGSGATGGWAAKRLSEAGLKVAILEAGRNISPKEFTEHMPAYKLKYRDLSPEIVRTRPVQKQCYACMEYNYDWFVDDLQNPYSSPAGKPFTWQRLRIVGGRTLVWGRQSYRMSDLDFKAASHDGYGDDWPLSYRDMEPYYDIVERYVGISGAAEGNPTLPDSQFLPAMKMSCGELQMRDRVKNKFGYTVTIGRTAILTQNHNGRLACHYCGPCERGCGTFSYFSSPFTTVADALKTKNCTLITNAVVRHVDMDNANNRAAGVTYIDRLSHQTYQVRAKSVILCAQAIGIDAHSAQLLDARLFTGIGEWKRRVGPLPDGSCGGRGRFGRNAGIRSHAQRVQRAASPQRNLRDSLPQCVEWTEALALHSRLWISGGRAERVQFQRGGLRRGL